MKKLTLLALVLALILCGCGRGEEDAIRSLQQRWANMESLTTESELTVHIGGGSRSFTVVTTCDAEGATTTITAPEELSGLSATVTGEQLLLRYEGAAVSAGVPSVLSPAACVPYLVRSVAEGYLLEYGSETIDGLDCLRCAFDTTAPDGSRILCTVWLERESGVPCYTEFSTDGTVVLTIRTLSFDMKEKEEGSNGIHTEENMGGN